ncbi:MAG: hypothetical protein QY309_09665 [Cyclobacteriaceae bacterium]|nr:MAG: hypothetical protein QY309_09665 [Cyclobacteriaceae bacterium]
MTKLIKAISVVFIWVSCNNASLNGTAENQASTASIFADTLSKSVPSNVDIDTISEMEFKDFFKFPEAQYYNLDKDRELMSLLSEETREFWRKKRISINSEVKRLDIWGYPLSHKVLNENIIRVTTVSEGEAGNIIIAFTFNRNYERIGTEILTSVGGDQGDVWRTNGEFINDSTFLIHTLTFSSDDSVSTSQSYIRCIRFRFNGQIELIENCH